MNANQIAPIAVTWRPLDIFAGLWSRLGGSVGDAMDAARDEQISSNLPPHLRHDIGELDCRPPHPASPDQVLRDRQTSLESMWLRYGV